MRVVDTSAWIEWLINTPTADAIDAALPKHEDWLVPTIVQLELAKWIKREIGDEKADEVIAFSQTCVVVPLESAIALAAAQFCLEHKLATADAIVYATARAHGADLLTCDAHFAALPSVAYIEKRT
ncbi:MAG: type II toxin-antitoxin system VapC family toxin [Pseudomonadota bacterium]